MIFIWSQERRHWGISGRLRWFLYTIFLSFLFLLKWILETRRLTLNNDPDFKREIQYVNAAVNFFFSLEHTKNSINHRTTFTIQNRILREKKLEWNPNNASFWKDFKCVATTNQRTERTSNSWTAPSHFIQYAFTRVFIRYYYLLFSFYSQRGTVYLEYSNQSGIV